MSSEHAIREVLFIKGLELMRDFCALNGITQPAVLRLGKSDRLYHLATCAFYRPTSIHIMVEKCALRGFGGRAWSWPAYVIDRTPYGVLQHELGHHVDDVKSTKPLKQKTDLFSYRIHEQSQEPPMTGYLGTDTRAQTFYMEWFAENFRLFVTNPDLSRVLRPKFYAALVREGIRPLHSEPWRNVLEKLQAGARYILQAEKKIPVTEFKQEYQCQFIP